MRMISLKKNIFSSAMIYCITILVIITIGCGQKYIRLYEGPSQPAENIAVLVCEGHPHKILGVDGKKEGKYGYFGSSSVMVELLPGWHAVDISYYYYGSLKKLVRFKAEPGHKYLIRDFPPVIVDITETK